MTAWCVFSYQSMYFFTNGVIIRTFITTLCFYDFSKTVLVLVKNAHLVKVWFDFALPNAIFLHWLLSSTLLAQLKPPEASEQAAKKVDGAALKLPPVLRPPWSLRTQVLKK